MFTDVLTTVICGSGRLLPASQSGFTSGCGAATTGNPLRFRRGSGLRFELRQRRVLPEQGFVRLSDVVRDYIEERFQLPASRKTTSEFLEALSDNNPLPEEQRPFLNDFLSAADQVKFAKAPPDTLLLNQAIDRAEKLISSTGKPEEEKEVKNV